MPVSRWVILVLSVICISPPDTFGGDLSQEPVGVRIAIAKDRLLVFTDTVSRLASVAYPIASSTNPAADDFLRTPPADYDGYGLLLTTDTFFNNGTWVSGFSEIGAVRLPDAGTVTAAYVRFDSHDGGSRQGDHFVLRSNEFFLGYSHRLADYLAIGGELHITDSSLGIDDTFAGFPRHTETDSLGAGFDLGMLMALSETLLVGIHGGVKWDRAEVDGMVTTTGSIIPIDVKDTFQTAEIRWGLGWNPTEQIGIYTDLHYIHVDSDLGTTEVGRFYLGTQITPIQTLILRFGTVVDTQPQVGFSTGLGYYGIPRVPIELAYAFNTLPEVRREFGRAHVISATIVILF